MASSSNSSNSGHKQGQQETVVIAPATSTTVSGPTIISRKTLQTIGKIVDPNVQLDEDTEDMLLGYSDEFLEQVIEGACQFAAHRKGSSVEVGDIELYLERCCNMWISTDPSKEDSIKPPKKVSHAEAHRQRIALIKKTLKKY